MQARLPVRTIVLVTAILCLICVPAVAQEDYVILRAFGHLPPFEGGLSLFQKGRDGNLYARHQLTWYRVGLDGTLTDLGGTPPPTISIDGGDGFFYFTDQDLILKFQEGGTPVVVFQHTDASEGQVIGNIIHGEDGHFYGLTRLNGNFGNGTFFRVTRDGVRTYLHSFTLAEGAPDTAQLTQGSDGFFYSTSGQGGAGYGVILRLGSDGSVLPLYTFNGTEGRHPWFGLREATDGWMYGVMTASADGSARASVFKVRPDGAFQVVGTFDAGHYPNALPTEASDGLFYGSTEFGIYQMTRGGSVRVLHDSAFSSPGWAGGDRWGTGFKVVEGSDGNYYGTASVFGPSGNGVLFRLNRQRVPCTNVVTPIWQGDDTYSVLYLLGAVKSETPALFTTWLVTRYGVTPLWLTVTPAIDPTFAYEMQMPFPRIGNVGVFTLLINSTFDVCADWKTADTGGPGPTIEELKGMLRAQGLPVP
jgi:hypothetical protein